jgi:hypothetical protein
LSWIEFLPLLDGPGCSQAPGPFSLLCAVVRLCEAALREPADIICGAAVGRDYPPPVLLSSRPFPPHSEPGIGSACKRLQQNSLHPARRDHCCASCGFDLRRIANGRSNRLNCPSLPGTEPSTPPSRSHGGQMAWQARTISSAGTLPSGFRDSPGLRRGYFRYRREISRMYSECSRAGPFTAAIIGTTMSRMFMRTFLPSR